MSVQNMPTIWIVADSEGQPLTADVNQHKLGPFAYSKQATAEAAVSDPGSTLLAQAGKGLSVQEVTGVGFIQDVIQRFSEQNSDVLILDEGLYPFTDLGASWVDGFRNAEDWGIIFEAENPEGRLNSVLKRISWALGVIPIQVRAKGEARIEECQALIREHVKLMINPESTVATEDGFLCGGTTFWVHTLGMAKFDRPDLEMRGVPAYFVRTAGAALNGWAAYSIDTEIEAGERLRDGGETLPISLITAPSKDPYWADKNGCLHVRVEKILVPQTPPNPLH